MIIIKLFLVTWSRLKCINTPLPYTNWIMCTPLGILFYSRGRNDELYSPQYAKRRNAHAGHFNKRFAFETLPPGEIIV